MGWARQEAERTRRPGGQSRAGRRERTSGSGSDLLRKAGQEAGATNVTLELLDKLARDLQDWLILKPTWRSRKDAEEKALGQLKDERRKRDEAQERLRHLCKQAGLDASGSPAELRGRFLEAKGEYDTWRQLTRETIPELERRLLKLDRKALEDRKQRLTDSLKKQQAADPALADLHADRTAEHYREEGRRAHRAVEEARKKVRQVENQLQALLAGPLRGREEVEEAKARAQHKLDQAHHFQAAIERAREVLEDVAEHSHRAWAKKLNDRAGKLIGSLCPALTELRFDEGLNLTAQDAGGRRLDQRQVDQQLNTGARDQLYLAARLAIAEELSGGDEALPLILDDPLVSSDDVRFTRGMRHLAETLASSQQVIVLTCHEGQTRPPARTGPRVVRRPHRRTPPERRAPTRAAAARLGTSPTRYRATAKVWVTPSSRCTVAA